jgi:preprotein translocase subunit SecG
MDILIYILTFFLVLDCLFLGLLILMQLPKKEAGLGGAAFGGGAVDALVGAGAGNVLTKATKWAAITFFVLVIVLSQLYMRSANRNSIIVKERLEATPVKTAPAAVPQDLNQIVVEEPVSAEPVNTTAPATGSAPVNPQQ